ncbi:hypothetical protein OOZ51_04455 [Arthrobacter sp. MI7-26]|uniref:hypothetical protein n=1 Tax=Arthrobacter sp. MI7-26 TaxID=2993653 RepID=UPI00224899F0|nr:hypothetical protein [Arthrobacter sp. MI7-26]MCX2747065.1 hypothetical protein [Arthrobacter sp. MI7-26]
MSTRTTKAETRNLMPGIAQSLIFILGAVVYGILAFTAAKPVLWVLYAVIAGCALTLAYGVLDYRAKGTPKPRWITPMGSFTLIAAIVFGSLHNTLIR